MANIKKAKNEFKNLVCIRLSNIDEKKIRQAAKKVHSKWLTFIRSSTLKEAGIILTKRKRTKGNGGENCLKCTEIRAQPTFNNEHST